MVELQPLPDEENTVVAISIPEKPLPSNLRQIERTGIQHEAVDTSNENKWDKIKSLYLLFCIIYFAFVVRFTVFTLNIKFDGNKNDEENQHLIMNEYSGNFFFLIIFVSQIFAIIYKIFCCYSDESTFWNACWRCSLNIIMLILSTCSKFLYLNQYWHFIVLGLNFIIWFNLFSFINKVPRLGVYILVVKNVSITFVRIAPIFCVFLLPFSVSFHLLLKDEKDSNITKTETDSNGTFEQKNSALAFFNTFVRTLVMMTGELDFNESIVIKDSWLTSSIFCLFLILITIISMNLLTGLAINDTSNLLQNALKTQNYLRLQTIIHLKEALPKVWEECFWKYCEALESFVNKLKCLATILAWFDFPMEEDPFEQLEFKIKNEFLQKQNTLVFEILKSLGPVENNVANVGLQNMLPRRVHPAESPF